MGEFVDYVVSDCPIMGTVVVRHWLNKERGALNSPYILFLEQVKYEQV